MTKPIKLLYVIQEVKKIDKYNFLASADIKIFGHTYLFAMLLLIGLAPFLHPGCFCFSVSLLFWKYKQMLLLANSREILHGHNFVCTCLAHNIVN